jgi:geranylgeranyl diphosphate synthase, type II
VTLDDYLARCRSVVDAELERRVPASSETPATIHQAMRYSLFAGGKRIRPILCMAAAEAVAGSDGGAEAPACALELVHTYSLIHDDLPSLDNDDYRRGRLTCHKVYGEAMAILAGDALLTLAFQALAELEAVSAQARLRMIQELACAAGTVNGMIGGQVADLEAEGKPVEAHQLDYIHRAKTSALIRAAVRIGAIHAGACEAQYEALGVYGEHTGMAFQIVDDVLDVVGTSDELGKTAGKDAAQNKATFPALYGVEASRERAAGHLAKALGALESFGEGALRLRQIAGRIVNRTA